MSTPIVPYSGLDDTLARDRATLNDPNPDGSLKRPLEFSAIATEAFATEQRTKGKPMADWNPETHQKLNRVYEEMEKNPPREAWVINLHVFPIRVNGGHLYSDSAPACLPNQAGFRSVRCDDGKDYIFSCFMVPWSKLDMQPEENWSYTPSQIFPIEIAGEYMREANTSELLGPGIFIVEGPKTPEELFLENAHIPVYDDQGRLMTVPAPGIAPGADRNPYRKGVSKATRPMTIPIREIYRALRQRQLDAYFRIVSQADADYKGAKERGHGNWYVNGNVRLMAEALVAANKLKEVPTWNLEKRVDAGLEEVNCINCGTAKKKGVSACTECHHPFDPLQAYKDGLIDFEHRAMNTLPVEQLAEALRIKAQREETRKKAMELVAAGDGGEKKGKGKKE